MGVTRYKRLTIPSASVSESLVDALSGLGERKRMIKALWPSYPFFASTSTDKVTVIAIKEQEEICDFGYELFTDYTNEGSVASNQLSVQRRIELNLPLERGEGFKVGFKDPGGSPLTGFITMEYEDVS